MYLNYFYLFFIIGLGDRIEEVDNLTAKITSARRSVNFVHAHNIQVPREDLPLGTPHPTAADTIQFGLVTIF